MDGIIFVAGLVAGVSIIGLRSRRSVNAPGVLLMLALIGASAWYVFA